MAHFSIKWQGSPDMYIYQSCSKRDLKHQPFWRRMAIAAGCVVKQTNYYYITYLYLNMLVWFAFRKLQICLTKQCWSFDQSQDAINQGDLVVPQPPRLHLSSAYLDRHGAYVMDSHRSVYLWISSGVSDVFCQQVFDVPNYHQVPDGPVSHVTLYDRFIMLFCSFLYVDISYLFMTLYIPSS